MTNEIVVEKLKSFKEEMEERRPALVISRMPTEWIDEFKKLALENYCNDYGWTLSDLLKERKILSNIIISWCH